uniref:Uncharacterized protein n=1 Tax=Anguilla anguilla TaxID=7936 RepID=A0A0E9Q374_ANGAN
MQASELAVVWPVIRCRPEAIRIHAKKPHKLLSRRRRPLDDWKHSG